MSELICPTCGTDEHLSGTTNGDIIEITCSDCGVRWERDTTPRCPTCGSLDVRPTAKAMLDKSRGTQLSIMAIQVVYLCPTCDADVLARQLQSNSPLPPDESPVR
jgi:predicted RNA-binding Zn-ribbon protein involved in translation (DUF1610 family)